MSLSEEVIERNMNIVKRIVDNFDEPRRKQVARMLEGLVGEEFFTAPASSKEEYHNCFPGGLCDHSLEVLGQLEKIAQALAPGRYDIGQTLAFVALFHDLGKTGDGDHPLYLPNEGEQNRYSRAKGNLYTTNRECLYMPIAERSVYVLQKFGVQMSADEYLAIRLHDGQYEEANRGYRMKEPDLALLVHFADRWATALEKAAV